MGGWRGRRRSEGRDAFNSKLATIGQSPRMAAICIICTSVYIGFGQKNYSLGQSPPMPAVCIICTSMFIGFGQKITHRVYQFALNFVSAANYVLPTSYQNFMKFQYRLPEKNRFVYIISFKSSLADWYGPARIQVLNCPVKPHFHDNFVKKNIPLFGWLCRLRIHHRFRINSTFGHHWYVFTTSWHFNRNYVTMPHFSTRMLTWLFPNFQCSQRPKANM